MYRSQEIIQIFATNDLPKDIIEYILKLEREITFQEHIFQMIYHSYLFHTEKSKNFFYKQNKQSFLNEILDINGDTEYLKKYCKKLYLIRKENQLCSLYVNSLRF